jgi:hypothetical protein
MKIRNAFVVVVAAIALSALTGEALASGSVSATANATVTVLSPVSLTKTQDLVFGQVVRPSTGTNTVALDTSDTVTLSGTGNGSLVNSTTTSAKFNVVATSAITYTTTQTLNFAQTGLTNISVTAPVATTGTLGQIPGSSGGTQEIRYGAQFDVSTATTAQPYTGTLSVTVNYN